MQNYNIRISSTEVVEVEIIKHCNDGTTDVREVESGDEYTVSKYAGFEEVING